MSQTDDHTVLGLKKLGALVLFLAGMALIAVSFNSGSLSLAILGLLLVGGGIILISLKIIRRNRSL